MLSRSISYSLPPASTMVASDLCDLRGASSSSISRLSIFVRPTISSWRGVGIFAHALRSCRYFHERPRARAGLFSFGGLRSYLPSEAERTLPIQPFHLLGNREPIGGDLVVRF